MTVFCSRLVADAEARSMSVRSPSLGCAVSRSWESEEGGTGRFPERGSPRSGELRQKAVRTEEGGKLS